MKSQKSQVPKSSGDDMVRSRIRNSLGIKAGESAVMDQIVEDKLRQHKEAPAKVTPEQRWAQIVAHEKKLESYLDEINAYPGDPEHMAREALRSGLEKLKNDPTIKVSEDCTHLIDLLLACLKIDAGSSSMMIELALGPHFEQAKSKSAASAKSWALAKRRNRHAAFLEAQDIDDTTKLASRLHKQFPDDFPKRAADASAATEGPPRGAKDAVRQWKAEKSLRSTGGA